MRALGIPFTEQLIRLDAPDFDTQLATVYDGSTVPVLIDGERLTNSFTVLWAASAIMVGNPPTGYPMVRAAGKGASVLSVTQATRQCARSEVCVPPGGTTRRQRLNSWQS